MSKNLVVCLIALIACGLVTSCAAPKKKPVVEPEIVSTDEPDIRTGVWEAIAQIKPVYFEYNKSTLRSDAQSTLKNHAIYFKEHADLEILVEGHCDERGTIEYNMSLGQRRANAVRNYLSKLGVSLGNISTISYGEEQPADFGHTESAWSKNRRAELKVRSVAEQAEEAE
ncbi:MAG: peptidoglycan-associated lipoprotein Pal [bacterium]